MKIMKTDVVTLPAHWASALINGDDSNFDMQDDETAAKERELLGDTLAALFGANRFSFVDVGEPYFTYSYHHHVVGDISPVTGGDVADYTVLIG